MRRLLRGKRYVARRSKSWVRRQWLDRRGTCRSHDLVLIVLCLWWGAWCVVADPPLLEAWPRLYSWTAVIGGAQSLGWMALWLGCALACVTLWERAAICKEIVLLIVAGWWLAVAAGFARVDPWLTSTPTYSCLALLALAAYVLCPPRARGCRATRN